MKIVLVVDDSSTMRRIHKMRLEAMQFQVLTASDGVEALDVCRKDSSIELVLTDVHMPNMDGLALTKELRLLPAYSKTVILVVTSDGTLDVIETAVKAGANDVLIKPFTADEFSERVKAVFNA